MVIDIPEASGDDRAFLVNLNGLVARLVAEWNPQIVYVVRISKWFDHKWLRFSGKGRVRFDGPRLSEDTALDVFWQDQLTFPPFNPKQIWQQTGWCRLEDGSYRPVSKGRPPHSSVTGHSAANLQRRVKDFAKSSVFVWFSSNSGSLGRASLLVYTLAEESETTWYASFGDREGWSVDRVKGIDQETVREWLPLGQPGGENVDDDQHRSNR